MTHEELLETVDFWITEIGVGNNQTSKALRAVVELHKPTEWYGEGLVCELCFNLNYERTGLDMDYELFQYPCKTIQAIEKELP